MANAYRTHVPKPGSGRPRLDGRKRSWCGSVMDLEYFQPEVTCARCRAYKASAERIVPESVLEAVKLHKKLEYRKWSNKNREHKNAWARAWYAKNREKVRARVREFQAFSREQVREYRKRWRAEKREQIRAYNRAWKARRLKASLLGSPAT